MGTLTNLGGITEPQIPAAIARDTEVASAIASHVAATDPHPSLWGGRATHSQFNSINFNDPNIPLGWIWIRAGGTVVNSFTDNNSSCFLLSLQLGSDMPIGNNSSAHKLQVAFPFDGLFGQCWTRKLQVNIWSAWVRI